jgi:predicted regulator of Ras-like GTPase activity (Roadblock/LC7/MglB family)
MGIDVTVVQKLLDELTEVGAQYVVVADVEGLSIAVATTKDDPDTIETMGALTSIVIPQGEQISTYLGGNFLDTVIHTKSASDTKSVLAYSLDTEPKTAILLICAPELEPQVVHQFEKIRDKIEHSLEGIAVEVRDNIKDPFSGASSVDKKISAFWDTLLTSVDKSASREGLKRVILDAKDNYMQVHGRFSPFLYQMNSYSSLVTKAENFEEFKKETLSQVDVWKRRALGLEEEKHEITDEKPEVVNEE